MLFKPVFLSLSRNMPATDLSVNLSKIPHTGTTLLWVNTSLLKNRTALGKHISLDGSMSPDGPDHHLHAVRSWVGHFLYLGFPFP